MLGLENLLEIKLKKDPKVIRETLNRIGIPNKKKRILYPSCYLYERDGKTYLVHFKRLFLLTREDAYDAICPDDIARRNAIAYCLKNWGLIEVDDEEIDPHDKRVFVLPHSEKRDWRINHKFNVHSLDLNMGEEVPDVGTAEGE